MTATESEYYRSGNSTTATYTARQIRAALAIAGGGKPVLPCKPDKSPYTRNGFHDATVDPAKITAFWNRFRGAKIGVPTGRRSGFFVVDLDRLSALGELPGELDKTRTIRTPDGGLHKYLNHVDGISNSPGALPDGIDIRGEGGYVIVPPSDGYEVIDNSPIADAPDWLLEALRDEPREPSGPGRSRSGILDDGEPIPEGCRNRTLFFYALDLKDQGLHRDDVLAATLEANRGRCQPPLPQNEVEKIVKSTMRYPVRSGTPSPEVEEFVDRLEDEWWTTVRKGVGGKTERDVERTLIEFMRRYGQLTPDGQAIEVSVSVRTLALAAATSFETISRGVTKRLAQSGKVVKLDNGRGPREAATWRLYARTTETAQGVNTQHSRGGIENEVLCVDGLRAPRKKGLTDLETPAFRWRGLVGKGAAGVLYILEAYGPMTEEEIVRVLGVARVRDFRRRGYLSVLVEMGLVEDRGGIYALYRLCTKIRGWALAMVVRV